MARAKITAWDNCVEVEEDDEVGGRISTTYFVPYTKSGYGYVRISDKEGRYPQVCVGLSRRGPTLSCKPEELAAVIRRERARGIKAEKRWLNKYCR